MALGLGMGLVRGSLVLPTLPPVNTVLPAIGVVGTFLVGEVASVTDGVWLNSPTSFTYQWQRDGVDIPGADENEYELTMADADTDLGCIVTAHNSGGSQEAEADVIATPALVAVVVSSPPTLDSSDYTAGSGYANATPGSFNSDGNPAIAAEFFEWWLLSGGALWTLINTGNASISVPDTPGQTLVLRYQATLAGDGGTFRSESEPSLGDDNIATATISASEPPPDP